MYNTMLKAFSWSVVLTQSFITDWQIKKFYPQTPGPYALLSNLSGALINTSP